MSQETSLELRQKFRNWADKEQKTFRRASRSVGGFALIGFAIGMLAIIAKEWLHYDPMSPNPEPGRHYLALLLEHGGLGLIVSSIAVFGYEWRSHAKKAFELSEDLNLAIEELATIKEQMVRLQSVQAWLAFEQSMIELLGGDENKSRLRNHISLLVKSAYDLKMKQNANTVQYLNVISWLIGETVVENAKTLVSLSNGTEAEWYYKVPTSSAKMAARILGAHMKVMESGESYDTISDVRIWENSQLKYFTDKTEEAVKRGVKVRRVFNLCTLEIPKYDGEETRRALERVNAIIAEHLELKKKSDGNYSVKFFSSDMAHKVQSRTGRRIHDIQGANFGLFRNVGRDRIIRFVVEDVSLSSMRLSYCKAEDPDVLLFEAVWNEATDENPFAEDVVV